MTSEKTPISVLQEMAQVNHMPPPMYDVQPKGNEFCVTVKFGKSEEIFTAAVAKTKQLAKQLCAKNALELLNRENGNFAQDLNQYLRAKSWESLSSSKFSSENYVGKLNELCAKRMVALPEYTDRGSANGKFIFECKMFDFVTKGQSKTKKDAKQKAAEAMLNVYCNENERRCRKETKLKEVAGTNNEMTYNSSSLNESFENYVGKLNEICSKRRVIPSYTEYGTKNGEFIVECKILDNTITRGQSKTKKDAKQKAAEAMLNKIGELGNQILTKSFTSSDEIVNLYKSMRLSVSFENYVGKLMEICVKKMLPLPIYTEWTTENGEFAVDCKLIYKSVSNVTQGHSRSKQDAKEKAARKMIQILTQCVELESQILMKSVSIVETVNAKEQKSTTKFADLIAVGQSDFLSVEYMNEEQLKMELNNLNVDHRITKIARINNAFMLKTKPTSDCKSFTFIATGKDSEQIYLELLRKAVFGMRILRSDLGSVLQ